MIVDHLNLPAAVRHEVATQAAVAALLTTGSPRHQAAVELDNAQAALLQARLDGTDTTTLRYRVAAAEAVVAAYDIAAWAVTA